MIAHTYGYPDNLRALAPAKPRKQQILPEKSTGNMYLADLRPWGNSKGGERSFARRCERQVRGGGPFIGEGAAQGGMAAGHGGCPHLSLIHVVEAPLT